MTRSSIGALPPDLTLTASTGAVTGTPAGTGTFSFHRQGDGLVQPGEQQLYHHGWNDAAGSGGSSLSGGTATQSMAALQTAATNLSNSAAALSPTQTFSQITSALTITGNGGQNVISVSGNFHLSGGANLTISGGLRTPSSSTFPAGCNWTVARVSYFRGHRRARCSSTSGSNGQVQTSGNANTSGIFLALLMQMQINGGVHNSEFISGG